MSARRPARLRIIAILIILVLLAGVAAVLLARVAHSRRESGEALEALLKSADKALAAGQPESVAASLSKAIELGRTEDSQLRIMKRALIVCRDSGDYSQLADWATMARKQVPAGRTLNRLAIYAALRSGQIELAEELLAERRTRRLVRPGPDVLQYLAAELELRAEKSVAGIPLPPELEKLVSLKRSAHPSLLMEQGKANADKRLFLDAALLWIKRGQAQTALTTLKAHLADDYHEPAAYISYDAGDTTEAARRAALLIRLQPENEGYRRFYGDIQFLQQRYDEAQKSYIRALQIDGGVEWQTILNLAAASERAGDSDSARFYTARAYRDFPESKDVLLRYTDSLFRNGKSSQAAELLSRFLLRYPDDPEVQLLYLQLGSASSTPHRYRSELWKLYNRNPDNPRVARLLLEYELGFADLQSAALVISQYEAAKDVESNAFWLLEAKGVHAALSGNYDEAEALLRKKLAVKDSWESRYNLALILGTGARFADGVGELMTAETLVPEDSPRNGEYRSRIRGRLGEYYAHLGDLVSARRELLYAVELDPANLYPRLVLKKLDEASKK